LEGVDKAFLLLANGEQQEANEKQFTDLAAARAGVGVWESALSPAAIRSLPTISLGKNSGEHWASIRPVHSWAPACRF
jgi:hypothetical protein